MSEKSPVQREFDDLIKNHLAPLFREHGFRRRGQTFARRGETGWRVIRVQKDRHSNRAYVKFWINYAIRCDAHAVFCEDDPLKFPAEMTCEIRYRAKLSDARPASHGELWGDRRDIGVVGQVVSVLTGTVLPWLDRCSNVDAICDMLEATPSISTMFCDPLRVMAVLVRHDHGRLCGVLDRMRAAAEAKGPREVRWLKDWWGWPRLVKLLK